MYTMNVAVLLWQLDVRDSTAIFPILQLIKIHLQYEIEKPLKSKECLNMEYIIWRYPEKRGSITWRYTRRNLTVLLGNFSVWKEKKEGYYLPIHWKRGAITWRYPFATTLNLWFCMTSIDIEWTLCDHANNFFSSGNSYNFGQFFPTLGICENIMHIVKIQVLFSSSIGSNVSQWICQKEFWKLYNGKIVLKHQVIIYCL